MARTLRARRQQHRASAPSQRPIWVFPLLAAALALLVFAGWLALGRGSAGGAGSVVIPHLHGLGYSADGQQLIIPAHSGLRIFVDGSWHSPDVPPHDYMGFAPTDDGFYSSGHPSLGTNLPNPLGLVKSTDGGQTLTQLGFEGESDFHGMAAGYQSHAVYILNGQPNSKIGAGLYYTLDDGVTWQQSTAQGVSGQPSQLAVHPTDASIVALATDQGLLLSSDRGDTFAPVVSGLVTAAVFNPDGTRLLYGGAALSAYDLAAKQTTPLPAPQLDAQDSISYIAVNPVRPQELAVATFERDIFLSENGGQTWQPIARDGVGVAGQ